MHTVMSRISNKLTGIPVPPPDLLHPANTFLCGQDDFRVYGIGNNVILFHEIRIVKVAMHFPYDPNDTDVRAHYQERQYTNKEWIVQAFYLDQYILDKPTWFPLDGLNEDGTMNTTHIEESCKTSQSWEPDSFSRYGNWYYKQMSIRLSEHTLYLRRKVATHSCTLAVVNTFIHQAISVNAFGSNEIGVDPSEPQRSSISYFEKKDYKYTSQVLSKGSFATVHALTKDATKVIRIAKINLPKTVWKPEFLQRLNKQDPWEPQELFSDVNLNDVDWMQTVRDVGQELIISAIVSKHNISPKLHGTFYEYNSIDGVMKLYYIYDKYDRDLNERDIYNQDRTNWTINEDVQNQLCSLFFRLADLGIQCVDLKPQNVVVRRLGATVDIRLIDWGGDWCIKVDARHAIDPNREYMGFNDITNFIRHSFITMLIVFSTNTRCSHTRLNQAPPFMFTNIGSDKPSRLYFSGFDHMSSKDYQYANSFESSFLDELQTKEWDERSSPQQTISHYCKHILHPTLINTHGRQAGYRNIYIFPTFTQRPAESLDGGGGGGRRGYREYLTLHQILLSWKNIVQNMDDRNGSRDIGLRRSFNEILRKVVQQNKKE